MSLKSPPRRWVGPAFRSQPAPSARMFVGRSQLALYLGKVCETPKQSRSDSNTDADVSIAASPAHCDCEPKQISVGVNTEDHPSSSSRRLTGCIKSSAERRCIGIGTMGHFAFPLYGIREEATQTVDPVSSTAKGHKKSGGKLAAAHGKRTDLLLIIVCVGKLIMDQESVEGEPERRILASSDTSPCAEADFCINKILKEDLNRS